MTPVPTQVTFRGLPHSDALEAVIYAHVDWLEQFYADILRCRVLIELPHRHPRADHRIRVRVELTVRGGAPIVINRAPSATATSGLSSRMPVTRHAEIGSFNWQAGFAVRQAFDAARRRLGDFAREQRGQVKTHHHPAQHDVTRADSSAEQS